MSLLPHTKWYQDASNLYITVCEPDLLNVKHEFHEDKLIFSASKNDKNYEMTINFYHKINPEKSLLKSRDNEVNIFVQKLEPQWWNFLVKEKKLHFIYVDWDMWKDEFDSDDDLYDYKLPDNFQEMMSEMQTKMQNK